MIRDTIREAGGEGGIRVTSVSPKGEGGSKPK